MAWWYLIMAGISEIGWAYGLKLANGFTNLRWSVFTLFFMVFSFYMFAKSMRTIPIGTAYAIFTGIGAAGTAIIGVVFLDEGTSILKTVSLTILILGIVGLKLVKEEKA
ncbi:MAG: hypothetical protein RL662_889 [Bacteroidota bacterium]|jgi:quaternary ammonium compound-resistance protein SugE